MPFVLPALRGELEEFEARSGRAFLLLDGRGLDQRGIWRLPGVLDVSRSEGQARNAQARWDPEDIPRKSSGCICRAQREVMPFLCDGISIGENSIWSAAR